MAVSVEAVLDELRGQVAELQQRNAKLEDELAHLKAAHQAGPVGERAGTRPGEDTKRTSRRGMLKALCVAAGTGAATLVIRPGGAAASNSSGVTAGHRTTSTTTTEVQNTAGGIGLLGTSSYEGVGVQGGIATNQVDSAYFIAVGGTAINGVGVSGKSINNNGVVGSSANVYFAAVQGNHSQGGDGVQGTSSGGSGVVGYSTGDGIGVIGGPASADIEGHGFTGVLGFANYGVGGEFSSSDGTGLQASSNAGLALLAQSGTGPAINATSASPDAAVVISNSGHGPGVSVSSLTGNAIVAVANNATVVQATASSVHSAVHGLSQNGVAVQGESVSGYGGDFSGGRAPLVLRAATTAGAPATGNHTTGELFVDSTGKLFFCSASGAPGTWKQVSLI